jgi:hypothetical protein
MAAAEGAKIAASIRKNVEEMSRICKGLDEETASRGPGDRWSPKQIVSHLRGREGEGMMPALRSFLDKETPRLDLEPANPHYGGVRAAMTMQELMAGFREEYSRIADFADGLSEDQLGRKAHVPALKESPMGEYPTLATFLSGIVDRHLEFHITHMKEILQALGGAL